MFELLWETPRLSKPKKKDIYEKMHRKDKFKKFSSSSFLFPFFIIKKS